MKLANIPDSPYFLSMSEEERAFLQGVAAELVKTLEDAERAVAQKLDEQRLDQDEHLALWELLPSRVKTAIKRVNTPPGVLCNECGLTGAHIRNCPAGGKFA